MKITIISSIILFVAIVFTISGIGYCGEQGDIEKNKKMPDSNRNKISTLQEKKEELIDAMTHINYQDKAKYLEDKKQVEEYDEEIKELTEQISQFKELKPPNFWHNVLGSTITLGIIALFIIWRNWDNIIAKRSEEE